MQSDVAIAKITERRELRKDLIRLFTHPVPVMIAGCAITELLQHVTLKPQWDEVQEKYILGWNYQDVVIHHPEEMLFSQTMATILEAGIILWAIGDKISPLAENVEKSFETMSSLTSKSIPALLALAK